MLQVLPAVLMLRDVVELIIANNVITYDYQKQESLGISQLSAIVLHKLCHECVILVLQML